MIAEQHPPTPTETGAGPLENPDTHLEHLLAETVEVPWYKSLITNIRDLVNPKKLPPLEVTSKPVPVQEIWGFYGGQEKRAGLTSMAVHVGVVALLFLVGTNHTVQQKVKQTVTLIAPDLAPFKPSVKKEPAHGGGGGGDRSPTPPSKGKLPKLALKQFVPPSATPPPNPKLVMEPTIVVQPDAVLPNVNMAQLGDPLAKSGIASNGPGASGGIGYGKGGGVGPGDGAGFGPGRGGNFGGGVYNIGGGVSPPSILYKVEPEYSEEARKAKYQGTVLLSVVVDANGNPVDLKVVKPLGLGLDQKAIEAVEKWRFSPGKKDGKPVAVQATIEVNFRLL